MRGRRAALAAITVILVLTGGGLAAATTPGTSGSPAPTGELAAAVTFSDIGPGDVFYDDVSWLASTGIATGWSDGTFRPTEAVTRQAVAAFLYRWLRHTTTIPTCDSDQAKLFTDVPATNQYCGAIAFIAGLGLTTGYPDGSFHPLATVSRQGFSAMLMRVIKASPTCPSGTRTFSDVPQSSPFCGYIEYAAAMDIVRGWSDGTFRPADSVKRQAVAAWMHKLDTAIFGAKVTGVTLAPQVAAALG